MRRNYSAIEENFPPIYDENGYVLPNVEDEYPISSDVFEDEPVLMSASSASNASVFSRPYGNDFPQGITITVPRSKQRTITKGRDFYVIGALNLDEPIPDDAALSIELKDKNGKTVREVNCYKKDDKAHLFIDRKNERLSFFGYEPPTSDDVRERLHKGLRESCIPDLVCSYKGHVPEGVIPTEEEALKYTWNKAYYTDTFFCGLIYGGEYQEDEEYVPESALLDKEGFKDTYQKYLERYSKSYVRTTDYYGNKIEVLDEGLYTLHVSLSDAARSRVLSSTEITIVIGEIDGKILSPFTYPDHRENLDNLDKIFPQQTLMLDPFPGMWISLLFNSKKLKLRINDKSLPLFGYTCNKKRAVFNDGTEYRGGTILFYDYGLMATSNAYITEMPQMIKKMTSNQKIALQKFRYMFGEPNLFLDTSANEPRLIHSTHLGTFVNMSKEYDASGSRVHFVRYELSDDKHQDMIEGEYDPQASMYSLKDTPDQTIRISRNTKLALVGVCDMVVDYQIPKLVDPYGRYLGVNRITKIIYDIKGKNGLEKTFIKPVELLRIVKNRQGKLVEKPSLFEFRHVFDFSTIPNIDRENELTINVRDVKYLTSSEYDDEPLFGQIYVKCCKVSFVEKQ